MSEQNESSETNPLMGYYRQYIGDPDRTVDVYAGFGLFFVGLGLGLVGVAVFLYSATLPPNSDSMYAVREVASVAAAVGLPALLLGVVVLLPVDTRMLYLGSAGGVVCLTAIGVFVWAYPHAWNVTNPPDYSAQGVALYSVGLVAVIGATGAALVAHRVEQATSSGAASPADASGATPAEGDATTDDGTVTEADVRADIERELEDAELTWGGVERSETRRLQLDTTAVDDADIDSDALAGSATETRTTSGTVNDAVSQLQGLQGGEQNTASGESTDDQAAALRELREQQQAEAAAEADDDSLTDRLRGIFN
ncbi:MAG: permease [Halorubrum sp.]